MARRGPIRAGLALALVFVITNVLADDKCRTGCQGASQIFKYADGTTYKYNFDSKIEITLSSSEGQKSTTEVKAQVLLTQQPQCNQILRLQNVQVITSDGKKYTNIPDVEKPIRLNFHDGHLEDSICTVQGDTQNSINIKRAVASLFQANLKSGYETDVFGLCPTDVTQHKEGNILTVQKTRNLNKCAYRESIKQDFLATAFNPHSEIKSSPILNGDYSSKLKIKNGVVDHVAVTENYLFVPFSVGSSGAKASIETKLQFTGTSKDNPQAKVSQPRSIIFEDPHPINAPNGNVNSILAAVKETAKTVGITVGTNTAKEFVNLVKILRASKKDDLLAVYNQVKAGVGFTDKTTAKKLFLDALIRAGTGDTIEVALELIKNKELTDIEQHLVYFGLSAVRHTTEASLNAAATLLNQPNLPREAYLGIGTLIGRHCRQHSCKNVDAVNKLTQKLIQKLGTGKANNRQEENDIIYVLKALGNTHHLNDGILPKITAIAQDKKAPNRLRTAALQTYLADPCKDKLRDSALGILKDIQQDAEVRIKAYLALAQCPNAKIGNAVKTLLENEPSYQVGGFIVSHIRNIRASANPDKELVRQHLGFINVPKRFPVDLRKWSLNSEFSYSIDTLGMSNSIESNLIYSQNSWLPRSTSLNLTADVFGHTFNFLELGMRQENLDRLFEHYLGPKGLLRSSSLQELWDSKGRGVGEIYDEFQERFRTALRLRRDVSKAEIDAISKQVQIKTNELNRDLDLDLSVKAFGSEILFLNINDDVKKWTPEAVIDRIIDGIGKGIDSIKNFEETLRSNLLFLDAEFAYPTSTGFPLRLGVEGASNVQIKAAGGIDLKTLFREDSAVKISLIPSANIEIAGRLTLDALLVENGLKVVSTLHTTTGGDLIVKLFNKNKGIDVKYSLPLEKQNLISATHDIVFHTRELGAPEHHTALKFAQNKDFSICVDQLAPFIGLEVCVDINGPNLQGKQVPVLPFPLAGDAKVAIIVERGDVTEYHFRHVMYAEGRKLGGELTAATIGKNGHKMLSLEVEGYLIPDPFFKVILVSPLKTATLEGKLTDEPNEKSASLRFVHDTNEYFGKIGVKVTGSHDRSIFTPLLEYKTPQAPGVQVPPYRVEGQVIVERKAWRQDKYIFDNVRILAPDQKVISINGYVARDNDDITVDVTASDGTNSGSVNGRLENTPKQIKFNTEVKNTFNPDANFRVKAEVGKDGEKFTTFFQIVHGSDLNSKINCLTAKHQHIYSVKVPTQFLIQTENELTYPLAGFSFKAEFEHDPKRLDYGVNFLYGDVKIGTELESKWEHKGEGSDYDVEIGFWALGSKLKVKSKRKVNGEESQIENSIEANGRKVEVVGNIKHHVKPQDIDVGSDLVLKLPEHTAPIRVVNGFKYSPSNLDVFEKVSSGGSVYADVFLKVTSGNANGAIKINLQDHLVVNGQVKAINGAGNADITFEFVQLKRVAKADSTFTINHPLYNFGFNLYPVFNEDKSKKISISTQNKLADNDKESKNDIDFFGHKLLVNAFLHGHFESGKWKGEVTLPNDHYFVGNFERNFKHATNGVINGHGAGSLEHREHKNKPGQKISAKVQVKNTNPNEHIYDVEYGFAAEDGNGKTLNDDFSFKQQRQGDNVQVDFKNKVYGSVITNPLEWFLTANHKNQRTGSFQTKATYGPNNWGSAKGTFDITGSGHPIRGDLNAEIASTSKILRQLKADVSGSILKADYVEFKGSSNFYADAPDGVIVDYSTSSEVKFTDKDGKVKSSVRYFKNEPVSFEGGYSRSEEKDKQHLKGNVAVKYGANKEIKSDVDLVVLPQREYKVDLKLDTPTDKYKSNRLQIHTKISEDQKHHQNEASLTSDGKKWTANTDLVYSDAAPSVDVKVKSPEDKIMQVFAKISKITDKQLGAEIKLLNQKTNFVLEGSVDANVESVDDFHVKITAHCPTLKIEKYVIDAQNKPAKTGRRIQVTAKSGGKNVLQGSTSYTAREEKGKLIIEGSGSFKVKDESKSANFKYIRQNLVQNKNGETGIEISFDAGLGSKAIDAELKVTNKQFRILNSYCEEKKQCSHVEIDAKTNADDINHFNQEIEIAVDLRNLGLSHEFGLKAVTNRKDFILDHTVDVHFQSQANSKYQYSLYFHPKEAGVSLTTPKRIVAVEANINVPKELKAGGKASAEIVFYMDKKNQPTQKTGLLGWLNVDTQSHVIEGEIKFTNPALRRALSISANARVINERQRTFTTVIDVFAQPNQKITITAQSESPEITERQLRYEFRDWIEVKSAGLNVDVRADRVFVVNRDTPSAKFESSFKYHVGNSRYNSAYNWDVSPQKASYLVRFMNIDLLKIHHQMQFKGDLQVFDSEYSSYGVKPAASHLEIKNLNTVKFYINRKESPNDKLLFNSAFIPGQIADFRAEIIKQGNSNELVHASVKLDEANFLKSDYGVQSHNIQELLLKRIRTEITNHVQELKKVAEETRKNLETEAKQLGELTRRASPNLTPLKDYYVGEIKKLKEEIAADKTIQEISQFLHDVITAVSEAFGETFAKFGELVESIAKAVHNSFAKACEIVEKEILPKLAEIYGKTMENVAVAVEKITDVILTYLAKLSQIAEKYQPELQKLGAAIGEISQDVVRIVAKAYNNIKAFVVEQWRSFYNEIKALPIFDEVKAQYNTLSTGGHSQSYLNYIKEAVAILQDVFPTPALKELVSTIGDYLTNKLSGKSVDDFAVLQDIARQSAAIGTSAIQAVTTEGFPDLQGFSIPTPVHLLNNLPKFVAVKFSPLSYLLREDVLSFGGEFGASLVNKPRNWVAPFPLYALVAQGRHIFTFDGKHLTFPGKCNYLLARDAVDGNFTVVGTYANGQLTAISLSEGGDTVTLKIGGQVLLNNAPAELPTRKPHVAAFRDYEKIELVSDAGVRVICGEQLMVCSVTVSGFYHGKLRGLLGNGNNEPYDDFSLPTGKIVTSESDFGNGYKMAGDCPTVKTVDHHVQHAAVSPTCDKLFGWESELALCYPFVSSENFKVACAHGVAQGVKDTEFAIAVAYVAACNQHGIPIKVPKQFVKCTNSEQSFEVGDTFSVKTPGKSADIVLLVDTVKSNEPVYKEYVQPLVQQLTNDLHSKGINDIAFHLVTYGGDNQWPSHVTIGGKLTFKGKAPNVKFTETPKEKSLVIGFRPIDDILYGLKSLGHDIELAAGLDLQARTYDEGLQYPFRAESIKSIIAVTANPCEVGRFYPLQLLRSVFYRSKTINLNLITPFDKLTTKDSKHSKEVVGFNKHNVFTVSQTKGRARGASSELHKELDYSDYCVDFTIENRGNVFVTNNFLHAKGAARKQFVQTTSHSIVEQFFAEEQGLDCQCKYTTIFGASNVCKVVSSKDKGKKGGTKS